MTVRQYKSEDCQALYALFYDTVHTVNIRDYTLEQCAVWAAESFDPASWDASFLRHYTLVAEIEKTIVGFGDIDGSGYLDRLYVHKDFQRKGIAAALCAQLEDYPQTEKIVTHASITARPFFAARGYQVVREQQVERQGILLTNYVMEKTRQKLGAPKI